jgi:hypothetical protein
LIYILSNGPENERRLEAGRLAFAIRIGLATDPCRRRRTSKEEIIQPEIPSAIFSRSSALKSMASWQLGSGPPRNNQFNYSIAGPTA